jgi:hypothetical protein
MILIVLLLVIAAVAFLYFRTGKTPDRVSSNWQRYFENIRFSSQDFYTRIEDLITEREIPDAKCRRVNLNQAGILSARREYLRVSRGETVIDICAAPFGTGFFVSWWLGQNKSFAKKLPGIGQYVEAASANQTYYQADTESMFRMAVKSCVLTAIDELLSADKGIRALSDYERYAIASAN